MRKPVHLSAKILPGPNSDRNPLSPVDYHRLFHLVSSIFPDVTVVLGWRENSAIPNRYTWDMVKQMYETVLSKKVQQPIAISVNAVLIKNSLSQIKWLVDMLKAQLHIYANDDDLVNANDLLFVRNRFPIKTVYYDLNNKANSDFNKEKDDPQVIVREMMQSNVVFRPENWKTSDIQGSKIYMGTEACVLQKGMLISNEDPYVFTNEGIRFKGRIEFFDLPTNGKHYDDIGIEVFFHVAQNANVKSMSGIRLLITANGELLISTHKLFSRQQDIAQRTNINGRNACFTIDATEVVNKHIRVEVTRHATCFSKSSSEMKEEPSSIGTVELNLEKLNLKHKHVAIVASNKIGFVAVENFVVIPK